MMPLPDKGDLRRPLALAIRSTRLLGIVFVLFGMLATLPLLFFGGGAQWVTLMIMGVAVFIYIAPGVLYLLCSIFLKQGKVWAVTLGIVLAGLQCAFALTGLIGMAVGGGVNPVGLGICVLMLAALGQLIWHLSQSFPAARAGGMVGGMEHGFEPVAVRPIEPGAQ